MQAVGVPSLAIPETGLDLYDTVNLWDSIFVCRSFARIFDAKGASCFLCGRILPNAYLPLCTLQRNDSQTSLPCDCTWGGEVYVHLGSSFTELQVSHPVNPIRFTGAFKPQQL